MKLEAKLGGSTGVLISAMLLSASVAHVRIREVNHLTERVARQSLPASVAARDLRAQISGSVRNLEASLLFRGQAGSTELREDRAARMRAAMADLAQLEQDSRASGQDRSLGQIAAVSSGVTRLQALEEKTEERNDLHTAEGAAEARDLLHNELLPLDEVLSTSIAGLVEAQASKADQEMAELSKATGTVTWTLWIATLLGAGLGGALSLLLGRHLVRGLYLVSERANAMAAGDLTGEPLTLNDEDQIGSLARAMNLMQQNLGGILRTAANTAGCLTTNAVSMRSASDQIHHRIDEQTQQTQQAASAMQEMSASIAEVSRHTQSAAETSRGAAETAREGEVVVGRMLRNMQTISREATETSEAVGLLSEDSKRIGQIVTVIGEIARKTNLLALNAAIEAARAGDQGRGFAVVAGEVRRLAESTAQATGEIAGMIQVVQNRALDVVASMRSSTEVVEQQVGTANQAGEALERIIGMAERVDRMIAQIAIAASQQASVATQSAASLEAIHALSNENLSEMANTAAGIEVLRSTAVTLERQVDLFRHDPGKTSHPDAADGRRRFAALEPRTA